MIEGIFEGTSIIYYRVRKGVRRYFGPGYYNFTTSIERSTAIGGILYDFQRGVKNFGLSKNIVVLHSFRSYSGSISCFVEVRAKHTSNATSYIQYDKAISIFSIPSSPQKHD